MPGSLAGELGASFPEASHDWMETAAQARRRCSGLFGVILGFWVVQQSCQPDGRKGALALCKCGLRELPVHANFVETRESCANSVFCVSMRWNSGSLGPRF